MPKSKVDKTRKNKLEQFKQNQKRMKEQAKQNQEMNQQIPEVREQPYWSSNDDLIVKGAEFESLYNGINNMMQFMQPVFGAAQSIMQRNIINGTIKVRFEKLQMEKAPDGSEYPTYVPMSDEEQAPHIDNFNKLVESVKNNQLKVEQLSDENVPSINEIVNENGISETQAKNTAIVDAIGNPISTN
jgi:hypothetical protein